jgi:hypothetical protein
VVLNGKITLKGKAPDDLVLQDATTEENREVEEVEKGR